MKAHIFVRPEFVGKSHRQIYQSVRGRHDDFMTIVLTMRQLEVSGIKYSSSTWEQCDGLDLKKDTILILPQQAFIAGKIRDFSSFAIWVKYAIRTGAHIILTHHHPDELTTFFGIRTPIGGRGYFGSPIQSLVVENRMKELSRGVDDLFHTGGRFSDEFTYVSPSDDSEFIPVVQKIPKNVPTSVRAGSRFLLLSYKRFVRGNSLFLLDVHATGRENSLNGEIYTLLLRNVLSFLSGHFAEPVSENAIIRSIKGSRLSVTQKKALIDSRIGQGKFRENLILYWNECAITGITKRSLLRASHIKPWRNSTNRERLDIFNGLLLVPNLDLAFDQGYITFSDEGILVVSSILSESERRALGIKEGSRLRVHRRHRAYLGYHRKHVFRH